MFRPLTADEREARDLAAYEAEHAPERIGVELVFLRRLHRATRQCRNLPRPVAFVLQDAPDLGNEAELARLAAQRPELELTP